MQIEIYVAMCKTTTRPWSLPLRPRSVGVNYDIYPHTNIVVEAAEWVLWVLQCWLPLLPASNWCPGRLPAIPSIHFALLFYHHHHLFQQSLLYIFCLLACFSTVLPWESLDVRCTWHTKMPWWSIAPEATAFKHRDLMKNVFFGNNIGGRIFYTAGRFSWKYATVL